MCYIYYYYQTKHPENEPKCNKTKTITLANSHPLTFWGKLLANSHPLMPIAGTATAL